MIALLLILSPIASPRVDCSCLPDLQVDRHDRISEPAAKMRAHQSPHGGSVPERRATGDPTGGHLNESSEAEYGTGFSPDAQLTGPADWMSCRAIRVAQPLDDDRPLEFRTRPVAPPPRSSPLSA